MKRENFVSLVMGTVGVILFGIGMCMCLLPAWNMQRPGVVLGCVGALVLLAMAVVRRRMLHKPPVRLSARSVGIAALGVVGALTLGLGMCMAMVWTNLLVPGIAVGCLGILLLMLLIPACRGLQ